MAYFSYSKGFKAGGFNGTDSTGVAANLPFKPEKVNAYELGLKRLWFNDTLLVNLDVFRSDYNNLQVTTNLNNTGAVISLVTNAATSVSQGVEFDTQWAITRELRLSVAGTYLESYYGSYPNGSLTNLQTYCRTTYVTPACSAFANPVPSSQNLSGRPTEFAPRWSGNLTATYSVPVVRGFQLTTEVTGLFSSSYFLNNVDDPMSHKAISEDSTRA